MRRRMRMAWEKFMVAMGTGQVPLVGYIVGLSQRDGEVPYDEYEKWANEAGIPADERVARPDTGVAFSRAVGDMEGAVPTEEGREVLKVKTAIKTVSRREYFIVREIIRVGADGKNEFVIGKRSFRVKLEAAGTLVERLDESTPQEAVDELRTRLADRMRTLLNMVVSEWLVEKVRWVVQRKYEGIPYTASRGGLWFVRAGLEAELNRHSQVLAKFAEKANRFSRYQTQMRLLPCVDSEEQRKWLSEDVHKEMQMRLKDVVSDLTEAVERFASGGEMSLEKLEKLIQTRVAAKQRIEDMRRQYSELLGTEVPALDIHAGMVKAMETIRDRFEAIASGDRIAGGTELFGKVAELVLGEEKAVDEVKRFSRVVSVAAPQAGASSG